MKKNLAAVSLLLFVALGQAISKQKSKTNEEWKTLNESNYSIQYPATWELDQSAQMGTSFILFSPLESADDKFRENVNLLIQDLGGQKISLDKYTEITEGQIKTLVTNSTLVESTRIKNDKDEYHKIIYSGDQGMFHLQFEQYYWVTEDKAFVLTFTSEKDKFGNFRETGEKILNSFIRKK